MQNRVKSLISQSWLALHYREQAALLLCGAAVIAFLFYIGIARPLMAHKDATARQLAAQEARFQRVVGLLAQLDPSDDKAVAAISGDTRPHVLKLAQEAELSIDRIQAGDNGFTLYINAAETPTLFAWLSDIETQLGLQPLSLTLRKTGTAQKIAAQIGFAAQR